MRSLSIVALSFLFAAAACGPIPTDGDGGTGSGGTALGSGGAAPGSGGFLQGSGGIFQSSGGFFHGSGGASNTNTGGALQGSGGIVSTGTGGALQGSGGFFQGSGGDLQGSGGLPGTGGNSSGGSAGSGGVGSGGAGSGGAGSGGVGSGGAGSGGVGSGGVGSGGAGSGGQAPTLDCNTPMPTSGGVVQNGNGQGGSGNVAWQLWSNQNSGSMTHYSVPAFSANWNNSGDFLARIGYEWGGWNQTPQPYEAYGEITAQFAYATPQNSTAGGFSYVGVYGWSTDPCVEWYIIEDSWNTMPVNPGNTQRKDNNDIELDGSGYIMYTRNTTGTGGSRCSSSITQWVQYYSIRKEARTCGTISITEHFDAWADLGMPLGNLLEAKILLEVGGGSGSATFPIANVTATNPDP